MNPFTNDEDVKASALGLANEIIRITDQHLKPEVDRYAVRSNLSYNLYNYLIQVKAAIRYWVWGSLCVAIAALASVAAMLLT